MGDVAPTFAQTVAHLMAQVERRPPHEVAVEDAETGRSLNIAALAEASTRLANAFVGLGLRPGERVAYVAQNHLEYVVLEFALLKAGLVKVPLNFRFAPGELQRCLELAAVRLIVADAVSAPVIEELYDEGGPLRVLVGARTGWLSFDELVRAGAAHRIQAPTGPEDIYHIRFSSGSTGSPKGIAISHRGARAAILGNTWVMSSQGPERTPRTLQCAPLVYAGGWSVLPTLLCGGTNVVLLRFDADQMLEVIAEQAITWMFAVPTMLRRMGSSSQIERLRTSSLSCLMLAGEPAAVPALEVVSEHTDAIVQCWGQTEAPASTTLVSRAEMREPALWTSIGRAIPGVEFSLLADGIVLDRPEPGVNGEIVIRTPSVCVELIGASAEHEARRLADGWWCTSDLGHFDDAGRLFIVGRASETIITGGTNIQPAEIERVFEAHPEVHEAVVVGVSDDRWGETPAAYLHVEALDRPTAAELSAWVDGKLARFKRPGHVFVSADPIPRASKESKVARGQIKTLVRGWVDDPSTVPSNVVKVVNRRG